MISFGGNLKNLREEKKLLQKDIAKIFNVSQATVSNWEAGRKIPEVPMLIAIAKYFGVTTDHLLGLDV